MRPVDRENMIYTTKLGCPIDMEEKVMFDLLKEYCPKGSKVLDIGCGSGEITLEISKLGYKTEGVDFSPIAIEKAKNNGIECRVIDVDAGLPYEDNQFDAVWMGDVIEHVFDPVFVLKEINRVVRNNGLLLLTVPYDLSLGLRIRTLFGVSYQEATYRERGQYKHHTFFSKSLIQYMLDDSSFDIKQFAIKTKAPFFNKSFITKNKYALLFGGTMIFLCKRM